MQLFVYVFLYKFHLICCEKVRVKWLYLKEEKFSGGK